MSSVPATPERFADLLGGVPLGAGLTHRQTRVQFWLVVGGDPDTGHQGPGQGQPALRRGAGHDVAAQIPGVLDVVEGVQEEC